MEERFAIATVVRRSAPISSHVGDRAVVREDGRMEGFVGGACSRDIVRRQALASLRTGIPRLVRIVPGAPQTVDEGDVVTVPMTCISEGAVDVYIEPHVPKRQLIVTGFTPVSDALAQLGPVLDFAVARFVAHDELHDVPDGGGDVRAVDTLPAYLQALDPDVRAASAAIAASQGHYDEAALRAFLSHELLFVGLLASPKRAAAIAALLSNEGIPEERLAKIHAPAGLAIGARKPAEVAVSILAEIVAAASETPGQSSEDPHAETCPHCPAPAPSA
jgi:xanthine dehydrogenase accessory factor